MDKKTKNLLLIGGVLVVGYLLYKNMQTSTSFTGAPSRRVKLATGLPPDPGCDPLCRCTKKNPKIGTEFINGVKYDVCADGCRCAK